MSAFDRLGKRLHKTGYYLSGLARLAIPQVFWAHKRSRLLVEFAKTDPAERQEILRRVDYYNKISSAFAPAAGAESGDEFTYRKKSTAYYIDFKKVIHFFPGHMRFSYLFGDIRHVPKTPTFLKSRPIFPGTENENSVLLKLNRIRHYYVVKDELAFDQKISKLVWRGQAFTAERVDFLRRHHLNPMYDVGDPHERSKASAYHKPFMSIPEQLRYKYILSIEGNDVATNTKWIMASNSLCLMRKPRYETWFMEGALIPDVHYVLLRDDYSDLDEKIAYYNGNPTLAENIIRNANRHVAQFFDERKELLISILVMQKYFFRSGQLPGEFTP